MFYSMIEKAVHENLFCPQDEFRPFPKIDDREKWSSLPDEAKHYYDALGADIRARTFPVLPAHTYMRFLKDGNRSEFEGLYFERRRALFALMIDECIQNKGENIISIIDLIWAMCEESTWVIHAHNRIRANQYKEAILPDADEDIFIDLFSAETASLLAWCIYLIGSKLDAESPIIVRRVKNELRRRILIPYLTYSDYDWMGLSHDRPVNNWNPWINENVLAVTLLVEKDSQTRNQLLLKIGKSVQRFIHFYAPDGGCDEGPAYFNVAGGSYLDCLELVFWATEGKASLYNEPLTKNMAMYIMNAHIAGKYYINFADAVCRLTPDGMLLKRAAEHMNLPSLRDFGRSLMAEGDSEPYYKADYNVIHRRIANLLTYSKEQCANITRPLPLSHAFMGIEVASARENASSAGFYFAAKGGCNMESHNHNDVGNYIVYLSGKPVLCDIGVETYSRKTFSEERYTIFTMQSGYHNTAIINGFDQNPGYEYKARDFRFSDDGTKAVCALDFASAYPKDAGVNSYVRSITLDRSKHSIFVRDEFDLASAESGVSLPLITRYEPAHHDGSIILMPESEKVQIDYDSSVFSAKTKVIPLADKKLSDAWQTDCLYRTLLIPVSPKKKGTYALTIRKCNA